MESPSRSGTWIVSDDLGHGTFGSTTQSLVSK